ncbi:MAG: 3-hydroxyacyl-ACP dehydratase [Desulfuromonadaceae bacterium]|nr:3-hydroxyacyl-ACP dehydratase [Desulfuromonadaceae bacterium]
MKFPVPAERLIPHRLPMRLIETLESCDGETGVVRVRSDFGNPFIEGDGTLAAPALLELLAQSYAAVQGYADCCAGEPMRRGYLVGARRVEFFHAAKAKDSLKVEVHAVGSFQGFVVVEGKVLRDGVLLAKGSFKLWIVPNESLRG